MMSEKSKRDTVDLDKREAEAFARIMKYWGSRQRIDVYRQLIKEMDAEIKAKKGTQ